MGTNRSSHNVHPLWRKWESFSAGTESKRVEILLWKEKTSWEIRKLNVFGGNILHWRVVVFLWRFLAKTEGNFLLIVWVEFICKICDTEPSFGIFSWESFLIVIKTSSHSPYSSYSFHLGYIHSICWNKSTGSTQSSLEYLDSNERLQQKNLVGSTTSEAKRKTWNFWPNYIARDWKHGFFHLNPGSFLERKWDPGYFQGNLGWWNSIPFDAIVPSAGYLDSFQSVGPRKSWEKQREEDWNHY